MKKSILLFKFFALLFLFTLLPSSFNVMADKPLKKLNKKPIFVSDEIIVKFKKDQDFSTLDLKSFGIKNYKKLIHGFNKKQKKYRILKKHGMDRMYLLKIQNRRLQDIIRKLNQDPDIEYAEPNYIVDIKAIPNDPDFSLLYGLHNTGQTEGTPDADIDAVEAWDINTGNNAVVIAVIDTGVDYTHQDLSANIWINPSEIPGNGIDDDGNGYIDDINGWDFINNDKDPMDDNGHGTHCSGTIAAVGNNNIGIVGVNWNAKIMPLKFLSASGSGGTACRSWNR